MLRRQGGKIMVRRRGRVFLRVLCGLVALLAGAAQAQEKGATRPGFSGTDLNGNTVVLFRPSVWVGEQSTGGLREPNADWTASARRLLADELARRLAGIDSRIVAEPADLAAPDAQLLAEHKALFNTVASSVMTYQFFVGNRLPTRKNHPFEWTLGEGTQRLSQLSGARYGLFINVDDQYGSVGRKMFQVLAAGLVGVSVKSGAHIGYAGLVDLQTGNLLWLNADQQMGGDVRTAEGMAKRVSQLLEDYPGFAKAVAP
jgi:hypothetical protein